MGLDKQYLTSSIQGDRFEIAGGKLAQSKSQNAQIRALGARLVKDHTKSLHDSVRMAHEFNLDVPKAPNPSQRWELQIVGSLSAQRSTSGTRTWRSTTTTKTSARPPTR